MMKLYAFRAAVGWTAVVALLLSTTGCSRRLTAFTEQLQQTEQFDEATLRRIQFYVSQDITLYRAATTGGGTKVEDGRITMRRGQRVEEIVIPRGTPGVLVFMPKENRLGISFDSRGGNDRFLMFGPHPRRNGAYVLLAKEWTANHRGIVTYNGKEYFTDSRDGAAALLVDLRNYYNSSRSTSRLGGRRVSK